MKIYFDVGANFGTSSIHIAQSEPDTIVYAFEPTPYLVLSLMSKTSKLKNYNIVPYAVSNFNGEADFHIAGQADWGCSSLLKFSEDTSINWPERTDFKVTQTCKVKVITLKSFILEKQINAIDYLHVDTQGSDLNVLYGLEEYLSIVKEGTIEAANKPDILYQGQNTTQECVEFLKENNFEICGIYSNDHHNYESNIHFKNKSF